MDLNVNIVGAEKVNDESEYRSPEVMIQETEW